MEPGETLSNGAAKSTYPAIQPLRALYLQETNFQIRFDSCHWRGLSDSYALMVDSQAVGYGSIKGKEQLADRDTIFEFYVVPPFRTSARALFAALIDASGASYIQSQSNDLFLSSMLHEFAAGITSDTVLFADHVVTTQAIPGAAVRRRRDDDQPFPHTTEPLGDYVMELAGEIVATGGFLLHYNPPFADLYMEVREDCRRRGYGSFLLQEVKRACYLAGRVPAARTNVANIASRATLTRAGLRQCGSILQGTITPR